MVQLYGAQAGNMVNLATLFGQKNTNVALLNVSLVYFNTGLLFYVAPIFFRALGITYRSQLLKKNGTQKSMFIYAIFLFFQQIIVTHNLLNKTNLNR